MDFLELHPGYQKWGKYKIANKLGCTPEQVVEAKALINGKGFKDGDVADSELFKELGFINGIKEDYKLIFYATPRCYCTISYIPDSKCLFDGVIKNKSELKESFKHVEY